MASDGWLLAPAGGLRPTSHNRRGYFWGDRFKNVIVENGETLINCLAYIDLNPIRAGLVDRPEPYPWNSLGYHLQTNNRDNFSPLTSV